MAIQGHDARQAEMKNVTYQTRVWSPDGLKKYYPLRKQPAPSSFKAADKHWQTVLARFA
jgi:hypothetical protein